MDHDEETCTEVAEIIQQIEPTWEFPNFTGLLKETVIEKQSDYTNTDTNGWGKEIFLEGIYIWYGLFRVTSDTPMVVNLPASHIQMHFCIQSGSTYFSTESPKAIATFKPQQHNLMLLPQQKMLVQWIAEQETEVFTINISPEIFFNTLPENHPVAKRFREGIALQKATFFSLANLPLSPKMLSTLFEIIHCSYNGFQKGLFIKAKVIELLAMQLEQYEILPLEESSTSLKKEDVIKMHLARQILVENLEVHISIKDLAQKVGTNDYSLKKYFKEVFGTTVFGYLHDFRMEKAKEQLVLEGSKISEVAKKMGYKHATHFTAAFKKYHGYLPNKMRIGIIQLPFFSQHFAEMMKELEYLTPMF